MSKRRTTACAALAALAIAGCGGDDDSDDTTGAGTTPSATVAEGPQGEPKRPEDDDRPNNDPVVKEDLGTESIGKLVVTERDFTLARSEQALLTEGVWTVKVVNRGDRTHALDVEGPNGETQVGKVAPGQVKTAKVYLVSGEYELYCPIADHADRGMRTTLPVGADKNPG